MKKSELRAICTDLHDEIETLHDLLDASEECEEALISRVVELERENKILAESWGRQYETIRRYQNGVDALITELEG